MEDYSQKVSISLSGGGPWGFRLTGGAGTGLPLVVSKIRRKSKAYKKLREGDMIVSVNGQSCLNLTYDQVMEIADKSGADLKVEIIRKEKNKENTVQPLKASTDHPLKPVENGSVTKELISISEKTTKISEEKGDIRIKSATLLPAGISFTSDINNSNTLTFPDGSVTEKSTVQEKENLDPLSSFKVLEQGLPTGKIDMTTCSKSEEVSGDDQNYIKTKTETKHEIKGNTEISFIKKEEESVSKSNIDGHNVTSDALDLNDLINATQKRLDSFKNGLSSTQSSTTFQEMKTETTTKSELKTSQLFSSLDDLSPSSFGLQDFKVHPNQHDSEIKGSRPVSPPPKSTRPLSDPLSSKFAECLKEIESDLAALNGGLGFTSQESSTVTTNTPFGSETMVKKKKMFSSSSFYEEPGSLYPTVEEQVEMARKIADSLAADTNKKSKGANMFYKRVKRSSKWIHEGPDQSDESAPMTPEVEPPTPDPSQVPFRPGQGPPNLKLILDPRHPLDATALRSSGVVINEHNVVSPDVCHGLVKDLHSPVGKGAALFAKRKKKSEEWVVDEEKVKALLREHEKRVQQPTRPSYTNQYSTYGRSDVKLVKTPWEAAMESPLGLCDAAFMRVHPDQLADTVIKAAEHKRRNSNNPMSPSPSPLPDIYAKSPRGWTPTSDFPPGLYQASEVRNAALPQPAYDNSRGGTPRKTVFQNFNTVPRLWKGGSAC